MIKWIFFDVGNVLFYDDLVGALIFKKLAQTIQQAGTSITFTALLQEREELVRNKYDGTPDRTLARKYLSGSHQLQVEKQITEELQANYDRYNLAVEGIKELLAELAKNYRLGLAANQVLACRDSLRRRGLWNFFTMRDLSCDLGLEKPDIAFFKELLGRAQCLPSQSIMIGDQLDNDMRPAKSLGMYTIWFQVPIAAKNYQIVDAEEKAFLESLQRVPWDGLPSSEATKWVDFTAHSPEDILEGVKQIEKSDAPSF
ncbi:hypothetical protein DRQ12_05650 [candidate division KSB1 bacterium]|nr:MAG: hypothetical protein DRQ12_05650 [candidate division KSB1 bacterium]